MRCCLIVVLICIFLMISDIEHFFMCLLAICASSSEKCLFKYAYFSIGLFLDFFDMKLRKPKQSLQIGQSANNCVA